MASFLRQVLTLLTTTPGSLTYHLVLAFSIAGALQASFNLWRASSFPQGRRMVIGLSVLLLLRLALFISAGFAWQTSLPNPGVLLPVLDRTAMALSLVLIIWLWAFPEPLRLADAATILLALLVVTLSIFSIIWWLDQGETGFFNGSTLDRIWESLSIFLVLIGNWMLLARRPNGWGVGLVMLLVLFVGHLAQLLAPLPENDYAGAVRLAQMAAYPLLLFLPQRFPLSQNLAGPYTISQPAVMTQEQRRGIEPQLFQALLTLSKDGSPQDACQALVYIVAQMMQADLCLVVALKETGNSLEIRCGYDLIRERPLHGKAIQDHLVPLVNTALRRGVPIRLPASSTSADLINLGEALHLTRTGPLLALPLPAQVRGELRGILLLSPDTNHGWTSADEAHLTRDLQTLAGLAEQSQHLKDLQDRLAEARKAADDALQQADQSRWQNSSLLAEMESLQERSARYQAQAESLAALIATREAEPPAPTAAAAKPSQPPLATGEASGTEAATQDAGHLQGELRLALEEVARLRGELAAANQPGAPERRETFPAETHPAMPLVPEKGNVILSIAQELRQPMSSLIGYTDLLLSESVGILGALQRKFLERIKASTERMGGLIEDLAHVTSLDSQQQALTPTPVDLISVIHEAVASTEAQRRNKNITLELKLAEPMPELRADRDALQQILVNLLQNAGAASPAEGKVSLQARLEKGDGENDFIFLQVIDSGGGIPSDELPRLFSRLYRGETALLPGVGDTGISLAVVKSLIEAHGGRIWVDSEMGTGCTYSVVLPIYPSASNNGDKGPKA